MGVLSFLNGYKTYISAIGLVGLGVYQMSTGSIDTGLQSILAAAAAVGLHSAIVTPKPTPAPAKSP